MKKVLTYAPRFRGALALCLMLALLPVASLWNVSQAKPPRHAPAYGYPNKKASKHKKHRSSKRDYRGDDDRYDRDDDDRDETRRYRTRYRTRINSDGERIREYFRSYLN